MSWFYQPLYPVSGAAPQVNIAWSDPFALPRRRNQPVAVTAPSLFFDPTPIVAAPVPSPDGWAPPLSQPRKSFRRQPLAVTAPYLAFNPQPVVPFGWHVPDFKLPVRLRRVVQQQFQAFDERPIVSFGWDNPLSSPARRPARPTERGFPGFDPLPITPSFGWYAPLDVPARRRPANNRSYVEIDPAPAGVAVTLYMDWDMPLALPRRTALRRRAALHPYQAWAEMPFVSFSWFAPMAEPRRTTLRHRAAHQPFQALDPLPIVSFGWFMPLDQPVRQKRALRRGLQLYMAYGTLRPVVSFGWHTEQNQPIRHKPRIRSAYRPFDTSPPLGFTLPFRETGPLYLNGSPGSYWKGRVT
jgi:hypothetical protein